MERYLKILKSYKRMSPELENKLRENVHPITVRKHEIIQPMGTVADNLYFVEKGLLHKYVDVSGKQETFRFKKEDDFIFALKEFLPNPEKDGEGIEALEDGILWCFPGSLMTELQKNSLEFQFHFRIILENEALAAHWSSRCSHPAGGAANYDLLRQKFPELLDRVPIPYLASFTWLPEDVFRHLHASKIKLNVSTRRRRKR